ncbi:MAG: Hsp70 family protein, partial [Firmicutes bacterium]|nr:Hsp70 family protein [Bacillota bacterium]
EEVEVKNQAETLIYETEKNVKELDQALSEDEKNDINAAKDALQSALNAGNIEDIKAKTEALTEKFHTISAKMYQQAQQAAGGQAGPGPDMSGMGGMGAGPDMGAGPQAGPADDNVVDADFEVVDDDEKTE